MNSRSPYVGRYVYVFVVLCLVSIAGAMFLPMQILLGRVVPDDGFYYLQIARNLSRFAGQTFDGIHWTNGYHPLWGWMLGVVALPLRVLETEYLFRGALLFNLAVYATGVWVFARAWRQALPSAWSLVLLLGAVFFFTSYTWLMETALVVLLTGALLGWLVRLPGNERAATRRYWLWFGIGLGLLGLARLDAVFLGALVFGAAGWIIRKDFAPFHKPDAEVRDSRKAMLLAFFGAAVILVPWLLFNRFVSGHWGTISGALKMHAAVTPPEHSIARTWRMIDALTLAAVAAAVAYLLITAYSLMKRNRPAAAPKFRILLPIIIPTLLALAAILHFVFQFFWVPWQGFAWTYIFQRLALLAIVAVVLEKLLRSRMRLANLAAHGSVVLVVTLLLANWGVRAIREYREPRAWTYHAYLAADWARRYLPDTAVLAAKDAGVLGYFSERSVVNLDGLVNNWDYQEALRRDEHLAFLRRAGVTHLAQHNVEDYAIVEPYRFWFYSALYSHEATPLMLQPNAIAYRSPPFLHGNGRVHVATWKFQ